MTEKEILDAIAAWKRVFMLACNQAKEWQDKAGEPYYEPETMVYDEGRQIFWLDAWDWDDGKDEEIHHRYEVDLMFLIDNELIS